MLKVVSYSLFAFSTKLCERNFGSFYITIFNGCYLDVFYVLFFIYNETESSRRRSLDVSSIFGQEVVVVREKRLVNSYAVKSGMLRFNFILDCCQPGSIPDAHFMAALLDLVCFSIYMQ